MFIISNNYLRNETQQNFTNFRIFFKVLRHLLAKLLTTLNINN